MAGSASTRKKRRIRSPHPGVVLIKPDAGHPYWRARFVDPDSGRTSKVRLDPLGLPTAETRKDWAIRKSRDVARTRMEHAAGGPRIARKPIADAVEDYFKAAENRLRPSTLELYRAASELLMAWAKRDGIETTDALTATRLPAFRDFLLARRKQAIAPGGKRGQRRASRSKLSPLTINWQLRAAKTMLNEMRLRGVVPLSRDTLADVLKPATVPREAPEFLKPADCVRVLEAALRHDAEKFTATREEHAGLRPAGSTSKYEPVAPLVACVLLTGMRMGEALALRWASVDLAAVDADGKPTGEIRLKAGETKTKHARTIGLDVCPSLRSLLTAMKLRAGDAAYVFGGAAPMSRTLAEAARKRLIATYGAPEEFTWQLLRSTCATYQCNAPSLFGAAAAFVSAKRLGHSITVSEKHYAGLFAVAREARTLEAAMGIGDVLAKVQAPRAQGRPVPRLRLTPRQVAGTVKT